MAGPRGAEGVPKKCQKPSRRIHVIHASTPLLAMQITAYAIEDPNAEDEIEG